MSDDLLQAQWRMLRNWLDDADVLRYADRPVGLGTWNVGDLVAHLGLGLNMLTEIRLAGPDAVPMSFGTYVAHYPPAAEAIAASTDELAADLNGDLLAGLDRIAKRAFDAIAGQEWCTVVGRRGAITYMDYLVTRLLELVVHGDDLARVIPEAGTSPVLDNAAESVAEALAEAYEEVAGYEPDDSEPMAWIRAATGRSSSDDPHLPLL